MTSTQPRLWVRLSRLNDSIEQRGVNLGRERSAWSGTWPFALLCLLDASRWLIEGGFPGSGSTLWTQAAGCAAAGFFVLLWKGWRDRAPDRTLLRRASFPSTLAAAVLIAGPALAGAVAGRSINANNVALALALVPVVVAVVVSAGVQTEGADLTGMLWPGLAGIAGLLLLVPEPTFGAWRPWIGIIAMPLLVGGAAGIYSSLVIRLRRSQEYEGWRVGVGLLATAAVFCSLGLARSGAGRSPDTFSLSAAGLDGLTALLTLLALSRLGAVRWSAQFLVVPLLGLGEGVIFLRPLLDWRSYLAFGLLGLSSIYQWLALGHGPARPEGQQDGSVPPS